MRIVSVSENLKIEKRIAITPEIAKKYIELGLEVSLPENYGEHLGIKDNEYIEIGVTISKDEKEIKCNDIARISLRITQPLFYDKYTNNRNTGSIILIDEGTNNTVGAGMII